MTATATLMSGTDIATGIYERSQQRADAFRRQVGRPPCLATVVVGDDHASLTYVRMKQSRSHRYGLASRDLHLPSTASTAEVLEVINELSADADIDGILLQHPVPQAVEERAAFEAIAPTKDVDGVTMHSFAAMAFDLPGFVSCTPGGILSLIDAYQVDLRGKHAVVIGRSPILGRPVGMLLLARDATVTYCHSHTVQLDEIVRTADIVIAAVGQANFVRGPWIKPGAVVIDAGYNEGNIGDVAFDEALARASLITPVPGGVGPMTIAMLVEQTVDAAYRRACIDVET